MKDINELREEKLKKVTGGDGLSAGYGPGSNKPIPTPSDPDIPLPQFDPSTVESHTTKCPNCGSTSCIVMPLYEMGKPSARCLQCGTEFSP